MINDAYSYEYGQDTIYCYPNSTVLRNKLNITNEKKLNQAEREITFFKKTELDVNPLSGNLDFDYLKTLHKHLFQDIYDWAGEIRSVDISKGNTFCLHELIEVNALALMRELKSENFLKDLDKDSIIKRLAYYLSEINTLHPFREGNGRTQRQFIYELARRNGYFLDFNEISQEEMIKASNDAFHKYYEPMENIIAKAIEIDSSTK